MRTNLLTYPRYNYRCFIVIHLTGIYNFSLPITFFNRDVYIKSILYIKDFSFKDFYRGDTVLKQHDNTTNCVVGFPLMQNITYTWNENFYWSFYIYKNNIIITFLIGLESLLTWRFYFLPNETSVVPMWLKNFSKSQLHIH